MLRHISEFLPKPRKLSPHSFEGTQNMQIKTKDLSQEVLKQTISYEPLSGEFTWIKVTAKRVKVGDLAGNIDSSTGYLRIRLYGKLYYAHHLAWLYVTGEFSAKELDHINCNRFDNRFENLREVTKTQNNRNTSVASNNSSGIKGLSFVNNKQTKPYYACRVTANGKHHNKNFSIHLFPSKEIALEQAITWLQLKRIELHGEYHNHG